MAKKLTNNSKIQVVSLNLDKDKAREYNFRLFLDNNNLNGINRKETILRMFEHIYGSDFLSVDIKNTNKVEKEDHVKTNNEIDTLKIETSSKVDFDKWSGI